MKPKRMLLICLGLMFLLGACAVQIEPTELSDTALTNAESAVLSAETLSPPMTSPIRTSSPEPLVYSPPTRINIAVERLPDYQPEVEALIVTGNGDPRFAGEHLPRLVNRDGDEIPLPANVQACSVNGLACCGDYMDGQPSAFFLMEGRKYAVMRLDGEIVTGFDYQLEYQCDAPYWYTYEGYLACRKESAEGEVTACLVDIRTGREIISDSNMDCEDMMLYDGVLKTYQNGMYRLLDYNGNVLCESPKWISVNESENIDEIERGGEAVYYLSRGELIESNLPAGVDAFKAGEYTVLCASEKEGGNILTVLNQDNQPIHTQWYDKYICGIEGGGLIVADGIHFTAITAEGEVRFFIISSHGKENFRYNACLADNNSLILERLQSWDAPDKTVFSINADGAIAAKETVPVSVAEPEITQLTPHIAGLMNSDYPEAYAMTDEAGKLLIEFGKYEHLEEKGGFVLAFAGPDKDTGRHLYDIYNTSGRLLLSGAYADKIVAMQDCMIVYERDTGMPSILYFDGSLRGL